MTANQTNQQHDGGNQQPQDAPEAITALRVQARNNYTCTSEQNITTWRSTQPTRVAVAIGLDEAIREDIERQGCSGIGAGAILLAVIDNDPEQEEEIRDLSHPVVQKLSDGSIRELRRYITGERRNQYWDGHNHVRVDTPYCRQLLDEFRAHQ